ncbi:uncharacterized protein LOC144006371 [Festucalex cinctus]
MARAAGALLEVSSLACVSICAWRAWETRGSKRDRRRRHLAPAEPTCSPPGRRRRRGVTANSERHIFRPIWRTAAPSGDHHRDSGSLLADDRGVGINSTQTRFHQLVVPVEASGWSHVSFIPDDAAPRTNRFCPL